MADSTVLYLVYAWAHVSILYARIRPGLLLACQMIILSVYLPRTEIPQRRLKANLPKAVQDGYSHELRSVAWLTFKVR